MQSAMALKLCYININFMHCDVTRRLILVFHIPRRLNILLRSREQGLFLFDQGSLKRFFFRSKHFHYIRCHHGSF